MIQKKTLALALAVLAATSTSSLASAQRATHVYGAWSLNRAIEEIAPHLQRTSKGYLALKPGYDAVHLSRSAKTLLRSSLANVNARVASGEFILNRDLSIGSRGAKRMTLTCGGGSNWFHWHWWGYDAGINHRNSDYFTALAVWDNTSALLGALAAAGWSTGAAWPVAVELEVYTFLFTRCDRGNGVVLTADWANVWCPVINGQ